jgi:hypothetical protein
MNANLISKFHLSIFRNMNKDELGLTHKDEVNSSLKGKKRYRDKESNEIPELKNV